MVVFMRLDENRFLSCARNLPLFHGNSTFKFAEVLVQAAAELFRQLATGYAGGLAHLPPFELRVTGRTTEEFLASLRDNAPMVHQENRPAIERILACCDCAKYAGYELSQKELEETHESAVQIVEATRDAPKDAPGPIDVSRPPSAFRHAVRAPLLETGASHKGV